MIAFRMKLLIQQGDEVARVQTVANLVTVASKTNVLEWTAFLPAVQPEREYSLVRFPKLPCPCHDATAVNPDWKIECPAVFEGKLF